MKSAILLSVSLLIAGTSTGHISAATMLYGMNTAPDETAPSWSVHGSTDLRSVTNGILRIKDDGLGFLQYRLPLNSSGRTLEARLRMDSSYPNGSFGCGYLGFLVSYTFEGTYVYLETNRLCFWDRRTLQCANVILADAFHVIRLSQDSNTTRLFIDGRFVFSGSQTQNDEDMSFGAASGPAQGDSSWDYVAFTDTGALSPAEFSFLAPQLTINRQGSTIYLFWNSLTNVTYQVQSCSNLTLKEWAAWGEPIAGNGSTNAVVGLIPPDAAIQFYRILVQQPQF